MDQSKFQNDWYMPGNKITNVTMTRKIKFNLKKNVAKHVPKKLC